MRNITLVIALVGMTLIIDIVGISVLAVTHNPIPDILKNVAIGALTGLVGLLVKPTPDTSANP